MSVNPLLVTAGSHLGGLALRSVQQLGSANKFADWLRSGADRVSTPPIDDPQTDAGFRFTLPTGPKSLSVGQGSFHHESRQSGEVQDRLARFHDQLQQRLLASGIDPSSPIRLTSDIFGGLASVDGHPESHDIEALLLSDPVLLDSFRQLVAAIASIPAESHDSSTATPRGRDTLLSIVELDFQGQQATVNVSA